jgi:hypothetical protein
MLDSGDFAAGENAMLPLRLIGVLNSLDVHVMEDLLNQFKSDDTIVGCLIGGKGALALGRGEVEKLVDPLRVEKFIDTISPALVVIAKTLKASTYNGESSLGRIAVSRMMSVVLEFGYRF